MHSSATPATFPFVVPVQRLPPALQQAPRGQQAARGAAPRPQRSRPLHATCHCEVAGNIECAGIVAVYNNRASWVSAQARCTTPREWLRSVCGLPRRRGSLYCRGWDAGGMRCRRTDSVRAVCCVARASCGAHEQVLKYKYCRVSDDRSLRNAHTSTLYDRGLHAAHMWLCACQTFNR